VSLDDYVSDYGTSDANMNWSVTGEDTLTVSVDNRILTVSAPGDDWFGSKTLSVTATDSDPNDPKSATVTVDYTITPVNDPPAFTLSGDLTVEEDFTTTETVTVTPDVLPYGEEGQVVTYSLTPSSVDFAAISFSSSDGTVTFTDVENEYGSQQFTVTANDNQVENNTFEQTFDLTINGANDVPIADEIVISPYEDTPKEFTLTASDIDGDSLTFLIVNSPSNGTLSGTIPNLTYTGNQDYHGSDFFTFSVNDGNLLDTATVTVSVNAVNDAPTLDDQSLSFDEDGSVSITIAGNDVDGDTLTYAIITSPSHGTISGTLPNITYTPTDNYNGADSVAVNVSDGSLMDTAMVMITVNAVNDAPVINLPSGYLFLATNLPDTVDFDPYIHDVENDNLTLTINVSEDSLIATVSDLQVTFNTIGDWEGSDSVHVTVSDGVLSRSDTVEVTVRLENHDPVFVNLPDTLDFDEDTSTDIDFGSYISDSDGDGMGLTATGNTSILVSISENIVTMSAPENWHGMESIFFTVSDGTGSSLDSILVRFNNVNDAPLANVLTESTQEDSSIVITLSGSDIDGDNLTFTIVNSPAHGVITGTSPDFTYTPTNHYNGTDNFTFSASDGMLLDTASVSLIVSAINDAPAFTLNNDITIDEDFADLDTTIITMNATPFGEENQVISYSIFPVTVDFATISIHTATGEISLSSIVDKNGSQEFTVTADDGESTNNIYSQTFMLTVSPVNDSPEFSLSGNINVYEDFVTTETVMVTPEDISYGEEGQTVVYSLSPEAVDFADVSIDANTGTVTITAVEDMNGSQEFIVTANDGQSENNLSTQTFTLSVFAVNDPPDFAISGDVTVDEDFSTIEMVTVTPVAVPADELEQTVTYSISPTSVDFATAQFDTAAGSVTITSMEDMFGSQQFTITADDGEEENYTAAHTFTLTVNPVNDAPAFTLSGDVTVDEDFTSADTVIVTPAEIPFGEEDQTVTYSLTPASVTFAAVSIDTSTGEIAFTAAADSNGSQEFTVVADDVEAANNTYEQTFILTVNAVNDAPVVADVEMEIEEDTSAPIPFSGYDVEDDSLTYSIVVQPSYGTIENGIYTPNPNFYSIDQFTYRATDGQLESNIGTITITVDTENDPPVGTTQNVITMEETPVIITLSGSDPESDSLTFALVSDAVHGTLALFDEEVTYTPELNYVGLDSFFFSVSDGEFSDTTAVYLTVLNVNDAPVAGELADSLDEDSVGEFTLTASDIDGDNLIFTVVSLLIMVQQCFRKMYSLTHRMKTTSV